MLHCHRCHQRVCILIVAALLVNSFVLLWVQQGMFTDYVQKRQPTGNFVESKVEGEVYMFVLESEITNSEHKMNEVLQSEELAVELPALTDYPNNQNGNVVQSINNVAITQQQEAQDQRDVLTKTTSPLGISFSLLVKRFPKYMIIGFGKAGTKALYEALKLHPSLRGPEMEQRYFSRYYSRGLQSYLLHMPIPPHKGFIIEKSPDYITTSETPRRIVQSTSMINIDYSRMIFIVVLRNPIDRAMSEYLEWNIQHKLHQQPLLPSFSEMVLNEDGEVNSSVAFLTNSCYAQHITNWLQVFDREQMCFVDGDKFILDPYEVMQDLEQCMELRIFFSKENFVHRKDRKFYCFVAGRREVCMNKRKGRRHPDIPQGTLTKLRTFFHPWNEQLWNLTGILFTS